jgi:hypothetical protein
MDNLQILNAIKEIAVALFRQTDPEAMYLIIRPDKAVAFNADRLMQGLPVNLVGHMDYEVGLPIRDFGIYRMTETGQGHNEIGEAWGPVLCEAGIAVMKHGHELTHQHFMEFATYTAIAMLESDEHETPEIPPSDATTKETR